MTMSPPREPQTQRVDGSRAPTWLLPCALVFVCVLLLGFGAWRLFGPVAAWAEAEVEVQRNGQADNRWAVLSEGDVMSSRDRYRIRVRLDGDAWVYVVQVDNRGNVEWLVPHNPTSAYSSGNNPIAGAGVFHLPAENLAWQLDDQPGVEAIYVFCSLSRWTDLEDLLGRPFFAQPAVVSPDGRAVHYPPLANLPVKSREQALVVHRTFRHEEPR
jgi:hypothetical protein